MGKYEAVIIAVLFDSQGDFEDIMLLGISHSYDETASMIFTDIERLIEDYEPHVAKVYNSRSNYDECITIAEYGAGSANYYCIFTKRPGDKE